MHSFWITSRRIGPSTSKRSFRTSIGKCLSNDCSIRRPSRSPRKNSDCLESGYCPTQAGGSPLLNDSSLRIFPAGLTALLVFCDNARDQFVFLLCRFGGANEDLDPFFLPLTILFALILVGAACQSTTQNANTTATTAATPPGEQKLTLAPRPADDRTDDEGSRRTGSGQADLADCSAGQQRVDQWFNC